VHRKFGALAGEIVVDQRQRDAFANVLAIAMH
jgi:hypothetical protein